MSVVAVGLGIVVALPTVLLLVGFGPLGPIAGAYPNLNGWRDLVLTLS